MSTPIILAVSVLAGALASIVTLAIVGIRRAGCPKGGPHADYLRGRLMGAVSLHLLCRGEIRTLDERSPAYLELWTCAKCRRGNGFKWTELGGKRGIDPDYVERLLKDAGSLKE